jgi:hypothetical protein
MITVALLAAWISANPDALLDRDKTLRSSPEMNLLREFDRQTRDSSSTMLHVFPRPCYSDLDSSEICADHEGIEWVDSARHGEIRFHPVLGLEHRIVQDKSVFAGDGGLQTSGGIGPASFYLDARIFSEDQSGSLPSYDGEYVESQQKGNTSDFTYASYSRYRTRLSIETPVGRFSAGRDNQNWGPSPFHALVLSEASVPYNHLDWTIDLGPFTVRSLVADLAIPGPGQSVADNDSRTLFAHRYEWHALRNLTLGISDALILFNKSAPAAFIPIVPLFMQKGLWYENINNGELAFDADWKPLQNWRTYGEFLIDDMTSPSTIFDNQWKNKWAATVGTQVSLPKVGEFLPGVILEWSRVEPWVYTHYVANTSQALNQGLPLGNPLGPNSQALTLALYATRDSWSLGLRGDLIWKGTDTGSQATDTLHDNTVVRKSFLKDAATPTFELGPDISWTHGWVSVSLGYRVLVNSGVLDRIPVQARAPVWRGKVEVRY